MPGVHPSGWAGNGSVANICSREVRGRARAGLVHGLAFGLVLVRVLEYELRTQMSVFNFGVKRGQGQKPLPIIRVERPRPASPGGDLRVQTKHVFRVR